MNAAEDSFVNSISEAAILVNERGIITRMNEPALKMWGYTKEEVTGKNVKVFLRKVRHSAQGESTNVRLVTTQ